MSNAAANGDSEALGINVIRGLAMDGPHAANSGHQGTAMALAPLAHVLYTRILRYDASAPHWADRDRFVLSGRCAGGHCGPADRPEFGQHFHFHGRIASGIEYLPGVYINNYTHEMKYFLSVIDLS